MDRIIIIGTGWYGCHAYMLLRDKYRVTMIEQHGDLFGGSSYYNQNRLHQGYHYCRDYATRKLCKDKYAVFLARYPELVGEVANNMYAIADSSLVDFQTYVNLYRYEQYEFDEVSMDCFQSIQGNPIRTQEKHIDANKAYEYFKSRVNPSDLVANTRVTGYTEGKCITVRCVDVNNTPRAYECEMLIDCTYNQLQLSRAEYRYELTCSLLLEKVHDTPFGAFTLMDGNFLSIYPRDTASGHPFPTYTLTDVEHTPIIRSSDYHDIANHLVTWEQINEIRDKMFAKVKKYYPRFEDDFKYAGYFLSKKTKSISGSDSRDIVIENHGGRVVTVNCGKIYGIFEFEEYLRGLLKL